MKNVIYATIFVLVFGCANANTEINPSTDMVKCVSNSYMYIFEPITYKIIFNKYIVDKRTSNAADLETCKVIGKYIKQ